MTHAPRKLARVARIGVAILLVALGAGELSAGTYYISWSTGNDANNGTSTATPWKRCPGMNGFAGSYSHVAGDRFIFRGGETWPNSAFQMRITQGGSGEATRDYYGVDTAWFTGASWSKPVFDAQGSRINNGTVFAAMIHLSGGSYITIDRIEFARLAAMNNDHGSMNITVYGPVFNLLVTGCLFRDWQIVKPTGVPYTAADGSGWDANGIGAFGTFGGGHGWTGSIIISNSVAHQNGVAQKTGSAFRNAPDVRNCEVYNTVQGVLGGAWVDGCRIHDFPSPTDPANHCNAIEIFGPCIVKNNRVYNLSNETAPILIGVDFSGQGQQNLEGYIYNNVLWNTGWQTPIGFDAQNSASGVEYYIWNNTVYSPDTWPVRGQRGTITIDYVEVRGNHFITSVDPPYYVPYGETVIVSSNVTHTVSQATALGYTTANEFAPLDATKPTVDAGTNIASVVTDILGVTRPKLVRYDAGAYEFNPGGAAVPGTIVFASSSSTIAETGGTLVVTVRRTGGTDGAVGVSYGTTAGTAAAGVNYTTTTGTLSWSGGDSADKTINVPILVEPFADSGTKEFTVTISSPTGGASLGTPSTHAVTITGSTPPPDPILPGLSWSATNGVVASPFISSNFVWQTSETTDPALGGSASYTFTNVAGVYLVKLSMKAESGAQNSLFLDFNQQPTAPSAIFDLQTLTGASFDDRYVSWRGAGQFDAPEFSPKTWDLSAGTNTLYIRGREAYTLFQTVTVELQTPPAPPAVVVGVASLSPNGYYKAAAVITNRVSFQTNVVVTGNPRLKINPGATVYALYDAGSGTKDLDFLYTVGAGETSAALDYSSTSALELNGGTIQHAGLDAVLTLPTPGDPGSISYGQTNVIDTTAPTLVITGPSQSIVGGGASVVYGLTYGDTNFDLSTLTTNDVTLNTTGTATAQVVVSTPGGGPNQTVTLVNTAGDGTVSISLASGTGVDLAGNIAPSSGPSATFTVDNTRPSVAISPPSLPSTESGPVSFIITYSDTHFASSTLAAGDITLNKTGTADAGSVSVLGSGTTRTVTLTGITGAGTLGISVASGTASDTALNSALGAGPSASFAVTPTPPQMVPVTLRIGGRVVFSGEVRIGQ